MSKYLHVFYTIYKHDFLLHICIKFINGNNTKAYNPEQQMYNQLKHSKRMQVCVDWTLYEYVDDEKKPTELQTSPWAVKLSWQHSS